MRTFEGILKIFYFLIKIQFIILTYLRRQLQISSLRVIRLTLENCQSLSQRVVKYAGLLVAVKMFFLHRASAFSSSAPLDFRRSYRRFVYILSAILMHHFYVQKSQFKSHNLKPHQSGKHVVRRILIAQSREGNVTKWQTLGKQKS